MLNSIRIRGTFRHNDTTINFQDGQSAIVGPNESGKSMVLEMIRFALWGTAALRGEAADYKTLKVDLDFAVKGVGYTIHRSTSKATLGREGVEIATGTKPVNQKIREIFGYDMSVFDVANACLQGKAEELGDMKPAQRKAMVDQTIGLHVLDDIAKVLSEEGLSLRRQADTIESMLREPVAPEAPANYRPAADLKALVEELQAQATERSQLAGFLSVKVDPPVAPAACAVTESVPELEAIQAKRKELADAATMLVGQRDLAARELAGLSFTSFTAEQLDAMAQAHETLALNGQLMAQVKALKCADYTKDELDAMERQFHDAEAWGGKKRLLAKGEHTCPKCDHHWPVAEELEHPDLKAVVETEYPKLTLRQIQEQRALLGNKERRNALYEQMKEVQTPTMTLQEITRHRGFLGNQERKEKLEKDVNELNGHVLVLRGRLEQMPDREADLRARLHYDLLAAEYDRALPKYEGHVAERAVKQKRFDELEGCNARLSHFRSELEASMRYEQALGRFQQDLSSYTLDMQKLTDLRAQAEDLAKARTAVMEAKVEVKSHLTPSLNKVSSLLLNQMTGGVRNTIEIDEDFNINVDGQALHKLSGSGKAVANLAIRIGLGQVLTNRVFSVFMGDEVDAAMDDNRAEYTAECLRRLTSTIKQVVIVTHKKPVADQIIDLTEKVHEGRSTGAVEQKLHAA
ncbi:SMC family ATPase [Cupriavidus sp. DL-D2]|uniref:ATP-binding protein n=1 Tax=Cupriavidus sp. DL-D2 TaxID=3144974 RepID=UPI0032147F2E